MDILKYIKNDFKYVPMVERIEQLEQRINMMESQMWSIDNRTRNTYERENDVENALMNLSEVLKELGVDPYKVDNIKHQLKEVIKWNY